MDQGDRIAFRAWDARTGKVLAKSLCGCESAAIAGDSREDFWYIAVKPSQKKAEKESGSKKGNMNCLANLPAFCKKEARCERLF